MSALSRASLKDSKLVVIKIGTSSLVDSSGILDPSRFKKITDEISSIIKTKDIRVVIVTSGAIAAGAKQLNINRPLKTIQEKQAAAAIGQGLLMKEYDNFFSKKGLTTAQVLLTRDAIDDRHRYINCRNTLDQIIKFGAVPIINENDTVSVEEIKVGDNDTLSALVANLIGADMLILLSDVDGFIQDGAVLKTIEKITKEIEAGAKGSGSSFGTGGMHTKIEAAKICSSAGIPMVIAGWRQEEVISRIISGEELGTFFVPGTSKMESKKRWVLSGKKSSGKLIVDDGAMKALLSGGKSLLPVGIKEIKGRFEQGDVVSITGPDGREIGRGVTNYNSEEASMIKGKKSGEIEAIRGDLPGEEIIHRDNMVML